MAPSISLRKDIFGYFESSPVSVYELQNSNRLTAVIITYGGIVMNLYVPNRQGALDDVVLGYNSLDDYVHRNDYFGCLVGRYANRIGSGKFVLDDIEYTLHINDAPNTLHGGKQGFDKVVWTVDSATASATEARLQLSYVSPDGQEGYPGTLRVKATYILTDANEFRVEYEATTDKPTVVNLCNHSYFNLAGEGQRDVYEHQLQINADTITPVDAHLIPTGQVQAVDGTPFDFRSARPIGERIRDARDAQIRVGRGYDHNFVLNRAAGAADSELVLAAVVTEPTSGRRLTVRTTEPGVQFYSGNFLNGTHVGKRGRAYRQGDGFCLETQHFPDSPNKPQFPSTVLRPGQVYRSTTVHVFDTV
eukprot:TRINITY_DN6797_c0_g2_i1.p1 TRINITY_DN6797_c0_g2~~TRINITY_DN6797_c0_g2_i1.p1  ORF type:complete len:362 (-),score=61.65 TRINITY_DN6797_c0_g2_i1:69-1154(-)